MSSPVGFLKNAQTNRYHPIIFRPAPPPSGDEDLTAKRYRSAGHHTEGFVTLEEALECVRQQPQLTNVSVVWEWDGKDIPAMTEWFSLAQPS